MADALKYINSATLFLILGLVVKAIYQAGKLMEKFSNFSVRLEKIEKRCEKGFCGLVSTEVQPEDA